MFCGFCHRKIEGPATYLSTEGGYLYACVECHALSKKIESILSYQLKVFGQRTKDMLLHTLGGD